MTTHRFCRGAFLSITLIGHALVCASCNVGGAALYLISGPEKAPALFTLPEGRTGVVFIDDRSSQAPRPVREAMGESAEKAILENKAAKDMVESRSVQSVVSREKDKKLLSITAVGRNVQADFVIYAWVDAFTLTTDGQTYSPMAAMRIKVVDTATGERIFPEGKEGDPYFPLSINAPPQVSGAPGSVSARAGAELEFGRVAGRAIAELFYEHVPPAATRMKGSSE